MFHRYWLAVCRRSWAQEEQMATRRSTTSAAHLRPLESNLRLAREEVLPNEGEPVTGSDQAGDALRLHGIAGGTRMTPESIAEG